jgi:CubicO group peptidase (beta-lactamase class C family)
MTTPPTTTSAPDNHVPAGADVRLTTLLEKLVARRGIHHANLAVMSGDGQHRWSAAAGPAAGDSEPLRPDTPFFIASITKRFIVTLVLQAHGRGDLNPRRGRALRRPAYRGPADRAPQPPPQHFSSSATDSAR